MTDEGAKGQPVAEPPPDAPTALPEVAETPEAASTDAKLAAPELIAEQPASDPVTQEPAPTEAIETPADATAAVVEASPVQEQPVPATTPSAIALPARRRDWAMLEFVGWRLLEHVATVLAAVLVTSLFLPSQAAADMAVAVERLQVSLPLLFMTLMLAAFLGMPLGYLAARTGLWADVVVRGVATLGGSLSPVWLSMLLVLVFANMLGWLQPAGFVPWAQSPLGALGSLILPALGLGLPLAAELALRFRDALRSAIEGPVVRTAAMGGMTRSAAIHRHSLRAALAETCGRMVMPLALVVPASAVVENVFYLPGLGRLIFSALETRDFANLRAGLVAMVALVALTRLAALVLQALADPRIARRA